MSTESPALPPTSRSYRVVALLVLGILGAGLALVVPRHEPWFDEAQAWLLARDASCWDIVWKYARYEGSPSLWHLLLALPAKAGAPPIALNAVSAALALVGGALLLFKSPRPWPLRLLLPLGYFFSYQYGVVARSYALLMPLLWLTAIVHARRMEHPWRYVGTLVLLSQVSLHAAWIAGAMMTIFCGELWWRERWSWRRWIPLAAAFAANTAFIVAMLWPPADLYSPPWVASRDRTWQVIHDMLLDCVAPWPALSVLVLICAMAFFYTRGVLLSYLLTTVGLLALFAFRFFSVWHQGMLFALLILHAWLAWASPVRRRLGSESQQWWSALAAATLTLTAAIQVWWAAMAGWHDWEIPYSGSRDAAAYLHESGIDHQSIHIFKFSNCAILLYLDRNPFANVAPFMPGSFWVWTQAIFSGQTPEAVMRGNPPWILVGAQLRPPVEPKTPPPLPGYAIERVFPGRMIWKDSFYRTDSYYLYRRLAPSSTP